MQQVLDRTSIRSIIGGTSCPNRDFSFSSVMMMSRPPEIKFIGCPGDLMGKVDEQGRFLEFYDDVPKVTGDQIKTNRSEPQEVGDLLDTFYGADKEFSDRLAPMVMESFETFMSDDPEWSNRQIHGPTPMELLDVNKTFSPYTVRDRGTNAVSNPYYDGKRIQDPNKKKEKTVVKQAPSSIDRRERCRRAFKRLHDTEFYRRRAQLQEAKDELKMREKIGAEVILLQTERDRAIAELNTLDALREPEKVVEVRQHINKVEQIIDGYNVSYGVEPLAVREPTFFESAVCKIRGTVAYLGGKLVSGAKRVFNAIGNIFGSQYESSGLLSTIPIIGGIIGIGVGLFKLRGLIG